MKKLLLLALVMLGGVMNASADNKSTVYYAVQSSTVGSCSVKLNINIGDNNTYRQYDMTKTGLTYTRDNITYDVYSCICWDKYGGVNEMQFQFYDESGWKEQKQPLSLWTTNDNFNNKMYVHGNDELPWPNFSASSYSRSVTENKFGTICLPFAATSVAGANVYKVVSTVGSGESMTAINLEEVDALEAGKAYIFKATSTTLTATLSGDATTTPVEDNGMLGNLSTEDVVLTGTPTYYVVSDNMIKKVVTGGEGVHVGLYKAYITLKDINPVLSRGANFLGFEEATTGIDNVKVEKSQDVIYNLQGQRMANAKKGLYIINGKKMLMK